MKVVAVVLGIAATASAQTVGPMRVTTEIETPRLEVAAGVGMTEFRKDVPSNPEFPSFGLSLSAGANLKPYVAVVGEASRFANYDGMVGSPVRDLLAGVRIQSRFLRVRWWADTYDLRLFGQLLVGARVDTGTTAGGLAIQPGGGADFHTKRGLTLRYEFDHSSVAGLGGGLSGGRFLFGLVFGPS